MEGQSVSYLVNVFLLQCLLTDHLNNYVCYRLSCLCITIVRAESVQYGDVRIASHLCFLQITYEVLLADHNLQPKPNQTLTNSHVRSENDLLLKLYFVRVLEGSEIRCHCV